MYDQIAVNIFFMPNLYAMFTIRLNQFHNHSSSKSKSGPIFKNSIKTVALNTATEKLNLLKNLSATCSGGGNISQFYRFCKIGLLFDKRWFWKVQKQTGGKLNVQQSFNYENLLWLKIIKADRFTNNRAFLCQIIHTCRYINKN